MASAVAGEEEHEGSRRKASWKDPEGRVISATTRADAAVLLGELHNQILAGRASFADLAAKHSDCSSARHDGDLAPAVTHYPPKSAHYKTVASPSARLGQLLRRAVDVGGRRKPRANPYTVAYNRGAGTPVGGGGARPRRVRRHLPLHGGHHGRVDGLQVHLQVHARGRGGRVPGGGDMRYMAPHPNIVTLNGAHYDEDTVQHVMELCKGGELFDRNVLQGHYTERVAVTLTRTMV